MRIYLILLLLMVPLALAQQDQCEREEVPRNIPCDIVSSWNYTSCSAETAFVYNSTGNNTANYTFQDFGTSGLCFFSWNITELGSYAITVSNGDSGQIIVRAEDNMTSLGVIIFLILLNLAIFMAPKWFDIGSSAATKNMIKKIIWIGGLAFLAFNTTIIYSLADTAGLGISRMLFVYTQIFLWGIYIAMIFLFWNMVITTVGMWKLQKQKKRMGEDD